MCMSDCILFAFNTGTLRDLLVVVWYQTKGKLLKINKDYGAVFQNIALCYSMYKCFGRFCEQILLWLTQAALELCKLDVKQNVFYN